MNDLLRGNKDNKSIGVAALTSNKSRVVNFNFGNVVISKGVFDFSILIFNPIIWCFFTFTSLAKKTLFNVKDYEVYSVSFEEVVN